MNTLKIECTENEYIIMTAPKAENENEIMVEVPEEWNCDYVNVVLWEEDICEILENGDDRILLVPRCGELLLRLMQHDNENQHVSIPAMYEDMEILLLKV